MNAISGQHVPVREAGLALGDSALQSQTLESVASAVRYHDWLTSLARPHVGVHPVELGSGLGDYAQRWLDSGVPRITVTEVDDSRLAHLQKRFADDDRVEVRFLDIRSPEPADHSAFVAFNVLEHIPDDREALRAVHALVRPGGKVVVLVPAFQFAMSRFDRAVGHVRRYTRASLSRTLTEADLIVREVHYVNMPGLLAWVVGMRLLRMTPGDGRALSLWDSFVIRLARRWEQRYRPPFGQSVFAVAEVPAR
ncbi:class I SAM-dependent methyltransferase [Blastococcus brunescens]|uniref:Class I SAM-dependent methyltransferase n=1 Tax=Blastococcus brunescens TaxID=1564165 RepID=A0ABZ1AXR2_9ACTN|nr:class I SAM-dependent methyltransferase [Blastococcus sp. BMG 8361]WRL62912.1 class I SAM-dependent methyltransferase [Blastococcus sp. BMG 8361]